jgi:hypothetical protein
MEFCSKGSLSSVLDKEVMPRVCLWANFAFTHTTRDPQTRPKSIHRAASKTNRESRLWYALSDENISV